VQRCEGADLDQLAHAAAPFRIRLHYVQRPRFQVLLDFPAAVEMLAGGDRESDAAA
jgi:hypothetical protein